MIFFSFKLIRQSFNHRTSARKISSYCNAECIALDLKLKGFTSATTSSKNVILSTTTCHTLTNTTLPNLFEGKFDTNQYPDEWHWRKGISREDAAREMCNSWKSSRMISSIVLKEELGQFVAEIMGWESVRLGQDDIVWKPPQPRHCQQKQEREFRQATSSRIDTVGFHQDSAYISVQFQPYENNSVTMWMALDDADEENGCLEYAVGSHKWRPILHDYEQLISDDQISSFHNSDEKSYQNGLLHAAKLAGIGTDNTNREADVQIESVPVKMGHAIFHHQDVWHGSGPNMSNTRHRRALVAHYLRGDIEFADDNSVSRVPFGRASYIYGRYKRYNKIELEETFFPIVYGDLGAKLKRTEWIDDFILQ